jgi:hypothetical protein
MNSSSEDDDFNIVGNEIFASFSPWASWLGDGNPFAPTAIPSLSIAAGGTAPLGDPGSFVPVTSGGITINLIYDAAALAAPASFRAGIQQAVAILAAAISDKITVNIKIDYSGTGRGAAAGPDNGRYEPYSWVRDNLVNNAAPGDTTFNALTAGTTIQGQSNVAVWNAQLKLWGVLGANDTTTDDGAATFATDIDPNLLVGVALHELTHAMGRVPYGASSQPDVFDFYRFTSSGTRLFLGGATAPAAYFSLDGGNTKVADYGRTSDASDFLNSGVQGPNDPFNEFYTGSTSQHLTAADLKQLNALGFHTMGAPDTGSVSINSVAIAEGNSGTHLATFTVTRSGGAAAFDIGFTTSDNSATVADHDYVGNAGLLHFDPNVNTQTISVTINGDTKVESDEAFFVNLSGATNGAVISNSQGIGTIINDDFNRARTSDFNGDGTSDILWRNSSSGDTGYTDLHGGNVWHGLGASSTAYSVVGAGDFNGDGFSDVLWRNNSSGDTSYTDLHGGNAWHDLGASSTAYSVVGTGDFNGDGFSDILFRNAASGDTGYSDQHNANAWHGLGAASAGYSVVGTGDFNGDGFSDVLWRNNSSGDTGYSDLHNGNAWHGLGASSTAYTVAGTGDFNGDGFSDVLWRNNSSGDTGYTDVHGGNAWHGLGASSTAYSVVAVGDYNGDGFDDVLYRNAASGDTGYSDLHANAWHGLGAVSTSYLVVA